MMAFKGKKPHSDCPDLLPDSMIAPQTVFRMERRENGDDEEKEKSAVGAWDGTL